LHENSKLICPPVVPRLDRGIHADQQAMPAHGMDRPVKPGDDIGVLQRSWSVSRRRGDRFAVRKRDKAKT
jgi:hypothetical protein